MKTLLLLAASLQLSILIASALVPRVLDWRNSLAALHPFLRRLFWVYGSFIVYVIIGFALLTFRHAGAMAAGEPVARSLCLFITIFWMARLVVQFAVFDAQPFLTNWFYKLGYHGLTAIFAALVLIYGWAAFVPGSARDSRGSFGDPPNESFLLRVASGESPEAARESRALPGLNSSEGDNK